MNKLILRNRLKSLRAERALSQADLAVKAGVSRKTINTIENDIFIPSTLLALKIAQVLELRVEEIFYLDYQT